jgi:non-specific serine/threonine protein kinase
MGCLAHEDSLLAIENSANRPYVFLSYASSDRTRAIQIADLLEARGVSVWVDRRSITGGTSWSAEIVRGIEGCAALLVLLSPASVASPNVQQEVQLAWESRRPILPLLWEPVQLPEALRYALAGRQWVEVLDHPQEDWLPLVLRALDAVGLGAQERGADLLPRRGEDLGASTPAIAALAGETSSSAPQPSPSTPPNNLPAPLTSFIGRTKEVAEVTRLLESARLVTLTGAGGCGKTRLAIQVARGVLERFPAGVWLIELAALTDDSVVPATVLRVLGLRSVPGQSALETLADYLRERTALLVVDNCEHLIGACASLVGTLLGACPRLTVLATSRELLGVSGEVTYRVPSLGVPDPREVADVAELRASEAVRLFVERVAAVQPGFTVTSQNARAVGQICQRLDGIPLAIELAAAWARGLSVEQIAARLGDRFRLLTGGSRTALRRQQTLRAAVDWSYELLSGSERKMLRRLAVFSGGWSLEAAEDVCGDLTLDPDDPVAAEDVLDLLLQLVDKSLVLVDEQGGTTRYRFLEMIRQYAEEKLLESGEAVTYRDRQRDWCLGLAEAAAPHLAEADPVSWLDRLEAEHDNLRAALAWCEGQNPEIGLTLAGYLGWFWFLRGYYVQGRRWLETMLQQAPPDTAPEIRARAPFHLGEITVYLADYETSQSALEESVTIYRSLRWSRELGWALIFLGFGLALATGRRDVERAITSLEQAVAALRDVGDPAGESLATSILMFSKMLLRLGISPPETPESAVRMAIQSGHKLAIAWALFIHGVAGEDDVKRLERSLALFDDLGDPWMIAVLHLNIGMTAILRMDLALARRHLRDGLRLGQRLRIQTAISSHLLGWAMVAAIAGDTIRAARLHGAAIGVDPELERGLGAGASDRRQSSLTIARASLGDEAFEQAWAEGLAMSPDEAVAYALEEAAE